MNQDKLIAQMRQEIQQLKARLDQRAIFFTQQRLVDRRILVDQGQELESEDLGIKYSSDPITELPSAYDPDVTTTFADGIGRGTLYIDGIAQEGYVICINDSAAGIQSAVIQGDVCFASGPIFMDNGTGTSSTVYRLF